MVKEKSIWFLKINVPCAHHSTPCFPSASSRSLALSRLGCVCALWLVASFFYPGGLVVGPTRQHCPMRQRHHLGARHVGFRSHAHTLGRAGSTASPTLRGTWAGALALAQPRQVQREREPAPHPPQSLTAPAGRDPQKARAHACARRDRDRERGIGTGSGPGDPFSRKGARTHARNAAMQAKRPS